MEPEYLELLTYLPDGTPFKRRVTCAPGEVLNVLEAAGVLDCLLQHVRAKSAPAQPAQPE